MLQKQSVHDQYWEGLKKYGATHGCHRANSRSMHTISTWLKSISKRLWLEICLTSKQAVLTGTMPTPGSLKSKMQTVKFDIIYAVYTLYFYIVLTSLLLIHPSQQAVPCLTFSLCGTLLGSQKCALVLFLASRLLFDEWPTRPCTKLAPHGWFPNDERCSALPSRPAEWHVQYALPMTACTKWMGRTKTCRARRLHTPYSQIQLWNVRWGKAINTSVQ